MHGVTMTKALNDNEPLTFTTLSAATERVLRKLHEQKNEQNDDNRARTARVAHGSV